MYDYLSNVALQETLQAAVDEERLHGDIKVQGYAPAYGRSAGEVTDRVLEHVHALTQYERQLCRVRFELYGVERVKRGIESRRDYHASRLQLVLERIYFAGERDIIGMTGTEVRECRRELVHMVMKYMRRYRA